jgi:hypothetical protein
LQEKTPETLTDFFERSETGKPRSFEQSDPLGHTSEGRVGAHIGKLLLIFARAQQKIFEST